MRATIYALYQRLSVTSKERNSLTALLTVRRHPQHMVDASETAKMYYAPDGRLFTVDPQGAPPGTYVLQPRGSSLQSILGSADEGFLDFLTTILSLDPDRRPTAQEALRHPWLASTSADSSGVSAADGEGTGAPHKFATQLYGYTSPNMSRSSSKPGSDTSSPVSSRDTSPQRRPSPVEGRTTSPARAQGPTKGGSSSSAERKEKKGREGRRGSLYAFEGPGVPAEFREKVEVPHPPPLPRPPCARALCDGRLGEGTRTRRGGRVVVKDRSRLSRRLAVCVRRARRVARTSGGRNW